MLITGAKERIQALEQLMLLQREDDGIARDLGWDATTLIDEFGEDKL
jgi:hypothetical protein